MRRLYFLLLPTLLAAEPAVAFKGARLWPGNGPAIPNATLVVQGGKIVAVGPADQVKIPDDCVIRDAAGLTIIPGLVDTHSHVGIFGRPGVQANADGNESTGPTQPGLRAIDAINPADPGVRMATAGGVTTANIMPGSGNVIGGQTLYVKLRGTTVEQMRLTPGDVRGGLKMANGENPKNYGKRGQAPFTRMKVAALQREQFVKARDYRAKWQQFRADEAAGKKLAPPERDVNLEPLVEVLDRQRTVHFHCHRADDILTAVRLSQEFGFELVLQHCTEGYRVAEELAKAKAMVSLTLLDSPGGKLETAGLVEENAAALLKAGVLVAINTDDSITESRFYLRTGSIALRGGLTEDEALKCLTVNPAKMLHLDGRLGALEAGKDADFAVLSGAPFSVTTQVLETYIDGVRVFRRADPRDATYQLGGFALPSTEQTPKPADALKPLDVPPGSPDVTEKDGDTGLVVYARRIHLGNGESLDDGMIVVEGGKIIGVGPRGQVRVPAGAKVMRANQVTPGLIDAHAVVPLAGGLNVPADQDQDELSDPNQADLRAQDGFHPNEPLLTFLREQGVTVIHALPGRANVLAGQSGIFRTFGRTAEAMTLRAPAALVVNLGEVPKSSYTGKPPQTRMATAALLRSQFVAAQADARKRADAPADKPVPRNLKLEPLVEALAGKLPVYASAHRADDLATALRLFDEFKLTGVLNLATEGYLLADRIAEAKVPVVVHPAMQRAASSLETMHSHVGNAAALAAKKIPLALGTGYEAYVPKTRVLRAEAAQAAVNGFGRGPALRAIALDAAKLLGIADRYGSIEPGKVADLVLYDGDPFEYATHVTATVMDGRTVYDRAEYLKLPLHRRALPLTGGGGGVGCCLGVW